MYLLKVCMCLCMLGTITGKVVFRVTLTNRIRSVWIVQYKCSSQMLLQFYGTTFKLCVVLKQIMNVLCVHFSRSEIPLVKVRGNQRSVLFYIERFVSVHIDFCQCTSFSFSLTHTRTQVTDKEKLQYVNISVPGDIIYLSGQPFYLFYRKRPYLLSLYTFLILLFTIHHSKLFQRENFL